MKKLIGVIAFLVVGYTFSQEIPKNISEETTIKTTKVNNGDEILESKVKVTTKEEQGIVFDSNDEGKRDKNIVSTPVKVTKIVEVSNPDEKSKSQLVHYEFNGNRYLTNQINNDVFNSNSEITSFKRENHYLFKNEKYTGIGYFDEEGNFIVEYSDKMNGDVKTQEFKLVK